MPDIQNPEQMISYYNKVIYPLEILVSIVNSTTPSSKFSITINLKGTMDIRGSSFTKRIS